VWELFLTVGGVRIPVIVTADSLPGSVMRSAPAARLEYHAAAGGSTCVAFALNWHLMYF
jgi:hypothetical protein